MRNIYSETHVQKTLEQMEAEIEKTNQERSVVERYKACVKLVKSSLERVGAYVQTHPFPDKATEINYFKELAPRLYGQYFYFIKVYRLELYRLAAAEERQLSYMKQEVKAIDQFFYTHHDFCRYFYMEATSMDEQWFTRDTPEDWMLDDVSVVIDKNFCLASYKVSWILANQKYKCILNREMKTMLRPGETGASITIPRYTWKGTNADAAELIYAFKGKKLIEVDGREAEIKDLAQMFQIIFQKDLDNIYDTHLHNQRRKKDKTPFLNSLIQALGGNKN